MGYDYLEHHGIKGMKWGRRRYQYKDGSLTPEGKKRYGDGGSGKGTKASSKSGSRESPKTKASFESEPKKEASKPKKKTVREMSDQELQKAVNRLRLEQEYRRLNPEKVSAGKKLTDIAINKVVVPSVTNVAKNTFEKKLQEAVERRLR